MEDEGSFYLDIHEFPGFFQYPVLHQIRMGTTFDNGSHSFPGCCELFPANQGCEGEVGNIIPGVPQQCKSSRICIDKVAFKIMDIDTVKRAVKER
ncbi:MAG: hypothetical protein STSR0009_20860 [Methanoregula sp.]